MMKTIHFIFISLVITFTYLPLDAEEPRLPDTSRISKILWEIPEYQPYLVPGTDMEASEDMILSKATEIFITRDCIQYGYFYTGNGAIDTVEEYCLAVFIPGKKLPKPKLQKAFDDEFPHNPEGYHRMAALWQKIYALNPAYNEDALKAVEFVIKEGKKKGMAITDESVKQYYEKAVRNSLRNVFTLELSKAGLKPDAVSLEKIIRPWQAYFVSPTTENFAVITAGYICVQDISSKNKSMTGLVKAYENAIKDFANESFHTHWTYSSSRSSFYEEDIEKVYKEYFADIPLFGKPVSLPAK